jgi:hypothetical protein
VRWLSWWYRLPAGDLVFPDRSAFWCAGSRFKVKSAALQCEMRRPPLVAEIPAFTEEFLAA